MQATLANAYQQQPQSIVQPTSTAVQDIQQQNIFDQNMNFDTVLTDSVISAGLGVGKAPESFAAVDSPNLPVQVAQAINEIEESQDSFMDLEPSILGNDYLYTDSMLPAATDVGFSLEHVDQSMGQQYSSYHMLTDDFTFI